MTKVLVLGAGGIIGQHLMDPIPKGVEVKFCRREDDNFFVGVDMTDYRELRSLVYEYRPDVVINLAGENRVDVVEKSPEATETINTETVGWLVSMCEDLKIHLIQVSTQGVFSGVNPPYHPNDIPDPITEYGRQKAAAEKYVKEVPIFTIARVTFVLGVRPFKNMGRINPLEQMFENVEQKQVNDRFFSPAFAEDVAKQLWKLVDERPSGVVHIGQSVRMSRYSIALSVYHDTHGPMHHLKLKSCSHEDFPGIAPRPFDTTWAYGSLYDLSYQENINNALYQWRKRENELRN